MCHVFLNACIYAKQKINLTWPKLPRLDMLSLSKIAHQMWRDHPFSQRNRTTERIVVVGAGGDRKVGGGWGGARDLKKWGRQYRVGVFIK